MEGGRSYSVFFILRAPHRLQLSRPVLIIPRREKKRPSPRGRACVPHRARGARHGTREATHAHTSKRVSRSRPSHFSRHPSQYNPPTSARASGRPPTPTTRRSRCFLQERGGQRCDGGGEGDVRTRSGLAQTSETHLARGVGLHAGRCATLTPPLIASLPGRSADSSLARCRPGRSRHRSFLCRTTLCKSWRLLWTRTTCSHSP